MKRILLSLATLLLLPSLVSAETYYVTQDGSGDGSGYSSAMGLSGFEAGSLGELDGDTVHFCGLFTSTVSIPDEGSPGNPVTIDGSCNGHQSLLKGWDDTSCALLINQKDYVTIQNMNIDCDKATKTAEHASQNGAGIKVVASSNLVFDNNDIQQSENGIHFVHISYPDNPGRNDNLLFTRNYIHDQPSSGIIMIIRHDNIVVGGSPGMGNVFKNNGYHVRSPDNCCAPNADVRASSPRTNNITISHNHMYAEQGSERGGGGIYINGADNILIEYNEMHGHEGYGNRGAITLKADYDSITKNAVVRYNHIYDYPYLPTSYTSLHSNIGIAMDWEYIYVYGNYIHDVSTGIGFDKGWQEENNANGLNPKEGHCWGNIIYNAENSGIIVSGSGSDIIESIYIHNNIIYNAGMDPYEEWTDWKHTGLHFDNTYSGIAKNNVVMDNRVNEARIYEISGFGGEEPETSHTLYYRSDGAAPQVYDYNNDQCKPCDWDSSGNPYSGPGDDVANPSFDNAGQGDFTLNPGSACIDSGTPISGPYNIPAEVTSFAGSFSYDDALHPDTDWSVFPSASSIKPAKQSEHGTGWERGAYVYDEGGLLDCLPPDECCSAGQTCQDGTFRSSPDCGDMCCVGGTCQPPLQTCTGLGYRCCSECVPGTERPENDTNCPVVCCGECQSTGLCEGLVLLYHFDNRSEFGESSATVYDFSGKGVGGTVYGAVHEPQSGNFSGAFRFDGQNDYIDAGDNVEPDGEITFSAWVLPEGDQTDSVILAKYSAIPAEYEIMIGTSGGFITRGDDGPSYNGAILAIDTDHHTSYPGWVHVAGTHIPGQEMRIYVNGGFKAAGDGFIRDASRDDPLTIGKRSYPGAESYFAGLIDELAVWNRSLTEEEIGILSGSEHPLYCIPQDFHRSDTDPKYGCVHMDELLPFIDLWMQDSTANPMWEMIKAVTLWKQGTGCVS